MKTAKSINQNVEQIESGLRGLIDETKVGNEALIKRSKVFFALEGLIVNLKAHTQRRLTGKFQPDPDAKLEELFRRYNGLLGRI